MVLIREEGWKEVKLVAISAVMVKDAGEWAAVGRGAPAGHRSVRLAQFGDRRRGLD